MIEEAKIDELIAGCLRHNRHDQKLLYKTFYNWAMGICIRYASNSCEAEEIMNHGFLKVFTNLHRYHKNRPFKAWVGRIMINTATDYYRSNLRVIPTESIDFATNTGHHELPDRHLMYNDLLAMIQRLPNSYRLVFNLYVIEGYTHKEIAKKLRITTGATKSSLFKARERLKKMLV